MIRELSVERFSPKQYDSFKTNECFRAIYETVYVSGGVDFVLYGHGACCRDEHGACGRRLKPPSLLSASRSSFVRADAPRLQLAGQQLRACVSADGRRRRCVGTTSSRPLLLLLVSDGSPVVCPQGDEGLTRAFIDGIDPYTNQSYCLDSKGATFSVPGAPNVVFHNDVRRTGGFVCSLLTPTRVALLSPVRRKCGKNRQLFVPAQPQPVHVRVPAVRPGAMRVDLRA